MPVPRNHECRANSSGPHRVSQQWPRTSILVIAYHVLRDGQSYRELGGDYFDHINAQRLTRSHTKRLAALGYTVTLTKCAA